MTKLLDKAIQEARKLSPDEQDALGAVILEEIADERCWAKKFAETRSALEVLAKQADAEIDAGEVWPLEFPQRK
ncbi:MAG: hypothetical protein EXQ89_07370 [Rhodospirillaceae bacterium]|nr:hypothetical protein [Rhodospirillaceae bacterium]